MQTFTGLQYLKMDVASSFGLDKEDWDVRLKWTEENEPHLEDLLSQAETPALYWAGVQALRKTQLGQPSGFPISLDAAASGLQLLACLTGCEQSASLCGVVSTGHREDAYTIIYQAMRDILLSGDFSEQDGDDAIIAGEISRADCKRAIMTSLYSSTREPKRVFGEGELLDIFYETMETMVPGAWSLNQALKQLWQPYALSHDWVLPDNFHAHCKEMNPTTEFIQFHNAPVGIHLRVNRGTKKGRSLGPNVIHSVDGMVVREMHRRCSYDPDLLVRLMETMSSGACGTSMGRTEDRLLMTLWSHYQSSGFLSARVLELIDEKNIGLVDWNTIRNLIRTLPDKPFQLISIHDCFRCLPNYGNDLRQTYNNILAEIADSDLLSFIASQITGHDMPVNKLGRIGHKIRNADYAIC